MMTLRDQICDIELCLKLKELNLKSSNTFCYLRTKKPIADYDGRPIKREWAILFIDQFENEPCFDINDYDVYPAFTESELMDVMPAAIIKRKDDEVIGFTFIIEKKESENIQYLLNYHNDTFVVDPDKGLQPYLFPLKLIKNIFDTKLANALAKMLIYLIENKLMVVEMQSCTGRLSHQAAG